MKKIILFFGVFSTVLLMVSTATAIPLHNGKKINENLENINSINNLNSEIFEKLSTFIFGGIVNSIITLIKLIIKVIFQIIELVQITIRIINLIRILINLIGEIFQIIRSIIDLFKRNSDTEVLLI